MKPKPISQCLRDLANYLNRKIKKEGDKMLNMNSGCTCLCGYIANRDYLEGEILLEEILGVPEVNVEMSLFEAGILKDEYDMTAYSTEFFVNKSTDQCRIKVSTIIKRLREYATAMKKWEKENAN